MSRFPVGFLKIGVKSDLWIWGIPTLWICRPNHHIRWLRHSKTRPEGVREGRKGKETWADAPLLEPP